MPHLMHMTTNVQFRYCDFDSYARIVEQHLSKQSIAVYIKKMRKNSEKSTRIASEPFTTFLDILEKRNVKSFNNHS